MALTVPTEELPPGMESTSHVTVVVGFPVTVAVKVWAWPVVRAARTGLMATEAEPPTTAVMVIVTEAVFVLSVTEVAVAVTVAGVGTVAGVAYVMAAPEALEVADKVPQVAPLQPAPVSIQLTPLFCASFCTVAVMLLVWPVGTDAAVVVTEMVMLCTVLDDPPPQPAVNITMVRSDETNKQLRDGKEANAAMNKNSPDQVTWFPLGGRRKVRIYGT